MTNENKVGEKTHSCLTPLGQSKKSVKLSGHRTHDFTTLYILCRIFNFFPPTPAFLKTLHSILQLMVSNAFSKSTKYTRLFLTFWSGTFEQLHTKKYPKKFIVLLLSSTRAVVYSRCEQNPFPEYSVMNLPDSYQGRSHRHFYTSEQ